jgi:hypothetical protein
MRNDSCVFRLAGVWMLAMMLGSAAAIVAGDPSVDLIDKPYNLDTGMTSRSISFENPTGQPGQGGKAASPLGPGRKGSPSRKIKPGETVTLGDVQGPGCIRHIWMTMPPEPALLRSFVIRGWWEGQEHPSIECPVGDFFGFAHGKPMAYQSAVHSVGVNAGMNFWLPMPFDKRAKFTLTNESKKIVEVYYQIDYTLEGPHPEWTGMLHVLFRRENLTTPKQDFELLPLRKNKGRYIGSVIGVRAVDNDWWGEGEMKVYMDGDREFPTICGTGSEDYIGLSWGTQQATFMYNGCSLDQRDATKKVFVSMYRWHLPDPIVWLNEARITIQQIAYGKGLEETKDDWSCATFWYETIPSAPLPKMPDVDARTADLWQEPAKTK